MLAIANFDKSLKGVNTSEEFIFMIRKRPLRKSVLTRVGKKFRFNNEQYAEITGVNVRTFQRKKPNAAISVLASEITMRLVEVYMNGMLAFDNDEDSFLNWLNTDVPSLDDKKPIELVTSGIGAQIVSEELLRMEYGLV